MIECVRAAVAHAEGMKVVLADIEVSALESAESKLKAIGAETLAVPTDVSRGKEIEALADVRAQP